MPRRASLFGCFGFGGRQPDIQYEPDKDGLQPVEFTMPMPDETELNMKFLEIVDELDLTAVHRKAMFDLPAEKKWQIYCSRRKGQQESTTAWPDYYVDQLKSLTNIFFTQDETELEGRSKFLEEVKTALRTQPMSFVLGFLDLGGLQCLIDILAGMDWDTCQSAIHTACIGCLKALMNNSNYPWNHVGLLLDGCEAVNFSSSSPRLPHTQQHGRSQVLAHSTCINIIAQSLITENIKTKVAVLEILGACCLVPGGHKKVMDAMAHFQQYSEERTRFQTLINDLDRSTGIYKDEFNLKIAIMSFINAALRYGAGADHIEFRIHLRFEFLMLGLQSIMDKLRKLENLTLNRHLDFFDMIRTEDECELAKRYGVPQIDAKSASGMLDVLKQKIGHTTCYAHLLSIMQHLLLLPTDHKKGAVEYWRMLDRIVQEISLQQDGGTDPDASPVELHVKYIIERLTMDDFKDDSGAKLAKREQEANELKTTVDKMADKLEKETKAHEEATKRIEELTAQITELNNKLNIESFNRLKLEEVVKQVGSSIPDDAKISNLQSMGAIIMQQMPQSSASPAVSSSGSVLPPPPAPPPLLGGPGAPPPPPSSGIGGFFGRKKNKLPKPSNPLKSFNWSKLPEAKIKGTLWTEIDDSEVISKLDFLEIDNAFSAFQRKEKEKGDDEEDFKKASPPKELSFIDNRRAQNCQILLSKIKLSNQEIIDTILSMDTEDKLSKDMLELMLKFVPSSDELNLLDGHKNQLHLFTKADRFLYDIGKIPHYEQRLKALVFKKSFNDRLAELIPQIQVVQKACKELVRSKRLRTLLQIVLVLGNYMNRGQRGNASGFKLSSLNKIIDTKSSVDRRITLLHYLLDLLERKFSDVFKLETDLPDVRLAAKVSLSDVEKEVVQLKQELKNIEAELEYQQKKKDRLPEDHFVEVMSSFIKVANFSVKETEEEFVGMKERFEKTVQIFGEDAKHVSLDEFFAIFESFLNSFSEAKGENLAMRKRKEEEERKARELAEQRERERQRAAARRLMNENGTTEERRKSISERSPGEFDDLISALRTGDVFGDEMSKFKGRKRVGKSSRTGVKMSLMSRERQEKPDLQL
eukprot:gene20228-22204_t